MSGVFALVLTVLLLAFGNAPVLRSMFLRGGLLLIVLLVLFAVLRAGLKQWKAPDSRLRGFLGFTDLRDTMAHGSSSNWEILVPAALILLIVVISVLRHEKVVVNNVPAPPPPAGALTTDQAKSHIGENATVCSTVVSTHYGGGGRTYAYFDKEWPYERFTIAIRAEDWDSFSPRPSTWTEHKVCVTGVIRIHHGVPNIIAESPGQISVK